MVEVAVGVDQLCRPEAVARDEAVKGVFFGLIDHAGVDYGGFKAFGVPHDVGVDSEHIENETAYFHSST